MAAQTGPNLLHSPVYALTICAALIGGLMSVSTLANAQGTKADYERAAISGQRVTGKVVSGAIRPHWIEGADEMGAGRFWYRRDLADGRRAFLLVDPAHATRQPAFDASRMAAGLSKILGRPVEAERLPIDDLVFGKDKAKDTAKPLLRVQVGGQTYDCDLTTYELHPSQAQPATSGLAIANAPRASRSGGEETVLTFQNRTTGAVSLFWLSTEGQRVAYGGVAPGASREMHTYAGHVWLAQSADGKPLGAWVAQSAPEVAAIDGVVSARPLSVQSNSAPRRRAARASDVSPDGKWRAFVRASNVVLLDTQTQSETPLTRDGTPEDAYEGQPAWSPDSRHFALMRTTPAQEHKVYLVESSPKDQEQPKIHINDYLKPGDRIAHPRPHLFDVTAKTDIVIKDDLFPIPWEINDLHWQPDSKRVTFLYNQRGHQTMRLIGVDAQSGAATAIIDEQMKTFIDYTNKVFLHRLDATNEAVWMSERDGWNHLYLYDTATGQVKNQITKGAWVVRGVDRVDETKRQIWFHAGGIAPTQDPYYVHYARINFDGSGLTLLTQGDGTHALTYSPDGAYFVDTYSRVDMPPVSELRRADTGAKILDLEKGDATALLQTGWKYPERFTAKGRDGTTDIYGVIVRPSNFDPARKYPVLENIYAGPQGAFVPKAFSPASGMQSLAELGFIVVQMDGMGTNWRSKAFHDVCWHNLSDAGFPDRIAWIQAAAKTRPYMDLSRVGIYGTSAGGQNALGGLLLHGDFYKAGMADCGCHDNRMDKIWWNEQWMGWPIGPWYAADSNVTLAPRLTGKLLLMVGEMDTNVDPASTMQVVDALIKADKDFELLVMPGQGHGVAGSPYGRRRLQDFFVRNLLGVTPREQ